jgi:hypothetical protein
MPVMKLISVSNEPKDGITVYIEAQRQAVK